MAEKILKSIKFPGLDDVYKIPSGGASSWEDLVDKPELFSGSWNDLSDKPFYENIVKETVVISPKTFTHNPSIVTASAIYKSECDTPDEDSYITVLFDGKPYRCIVGNVDVNNKEISFIGRLRIKYPQFKNGDYDGWDAPFFIEFNVDNNDGTGNKFTLISVEDKETEHTIEAFIGSYEFKRLDAKYIYGNTSVNVGQALVVNAVNENGVPTELEGADLFSGSWNDLTDKPFGETISVGNKFVEYQEIGAGSNAIVVTGQGQFSNGLPTGTQLVIFDGESYVAETIMRGFMVPEVIIGNGSLITEPYNGVPYEDNGMPFAIYYDRRTRQTQLLTKDNTVSHTIEAYMATYESKQLDEKFIPDTIARVSDIPDIPNIDNVELITLAEIDAICGTSITVVDATIETF